MVGNIRNFLKITLIILFFLLSTIASGSITRATSELTLSVPSDGVPLPISISEQHQNKTVSLVRIFNNEKFQAPWVEINTSAGWSARHGSTSVVMADDSVVLMGGYNDTVGYVNDVWRSMDNGATWNLMNASAGWAGRTAHSSVVMSDDSIILTGGMGVADEKNDTWRSTDHGATWNLMNASSGWTARYYHSSVAMPDGSIIIMGGNNYGALTNDVWRSTDNGSSWTLVNSNADWTPRDLHSGVAMSDNSIVLIGGSGNYYMNDEWHSTDEGVTWTRMNASCGWTPRNGQTSVLMSDGNLIMTGGFSGYNGGSGYLNDTWISSDNGSTWIQVKSSPKWIARTGHTIVAMSDGSVLLMGGSGSDHHNKNDVWRFKLPGTLERN